MQQISVGSKLGTAKVAVGEGLETKINLIIGANSTEQAVDEQRKIDIAAELGVHTIIDLSTVRLSQPLWNYGREKFPNIAFGKVAPILVAVESDGQVTPERLWKEIERSVLEGIDYMTLNLLPMKLSDLDVVRGRPFLTTSRQGGVLLKYMMQHNVENPYIPILPDLLRLFAEYNVTMHIGSTFRPTAVTEANDQAHCWEMDQQLMLYRQTQEAGVSAIVEPLSHHPLSDIGPCMDRLRKGYGEYVPFQLLGPIVTEVNYNSDQYASCIGAATAAMHNVGKITTIPPREHVGFPSLRDTVEGMKAALTAVHAGDLARIPSLMESDKKVSSDRAAVKSCNPNSSTPACNKCQDLCPLILEVGHHGI